MNKVKNRFRIMTCERRSRIAQSSQEGENTKPKRHTHLLVIYENGRVIKEIIGKEKKNRKSF